MVIDVEKCARCGEDHDDVAFQRFERPIKHKEEWTHWGTCPKTGEPIILRVEVELADGKY